MEHTSDPAARSRKDVPVIANINPTTFDLDASPFNCWRTTCVRDLQILRSPRDEQQPSPPANPDVLLTLRKNDRITRQVIFWGERTELNGEPFITPYKIRADSRIVLPYNDETETWADLVCVEKNKMSGHLELEVVYIGALVAVKYLARYYGGEYLKLNAVRGSWTSLPYRYDYELAGFLGKLPTILSVALLTGHEPLD